MDRKNSNISQKRRQRKIKHKKSQLVYFDKNLPVRYRNNTKFSTGPLALNILT